MTITSIDKIEIEQQYMHTSSANIIVRIFYNDGSKFEKSLVYQGVNTTFLQLMYALYVIFDKTNNIDIYYDILTKMLCTASKENYSIFSIQLLTKFTSDLIVTYVCDDYKNLQANLDLDWSKINVDTLRNYKVIITEPWF